MTLIMMGAMLIVGGIAVDLMRFESRRAMVQGVTDQAVLAAANLNNKLDPTSVVYDYFTKAGELASLEEAPYVVNGVSSRELRVKGFVDVDTFFFDMELGPYKLTAPTTLRARSTSSAIQGVGTVEVSLVVDISGSMLYDVPGTGKTRMQLLQEAANGFVDDLLDPMYADRVSISLVPYSEQVNIGPEIFSRIQTTDDHDFSHCIEFPAGEFSKTAFDFGLTYQQTQAVQLFGYGSRINGTDDNSNAAVDKPVCPHRSYESVVPFTQNRDALKNRIAQLEPRGGTAIFMGLKWGVALLDPSFQPLIQSLPNSLRDPVFADRPHPFNASRNAATTGATLKYVILMTDGQNSKSYRLSDEWLDTPSEKHYFANHNLRYAESYLLNMSARYQSDFDGANPSLLTLYDEAAGDGHMTSMCNAAKSEGIQIYAISVTADDPSEEAIAGRTLMRNCATGPNTYFTSNGANLDAIFSQIATQITELRLSQ